MVRHYSKDTQPGNGITQGYTELADRLETIEEAIKALTLFVAGVVKGQQPFPRGEDLTYSRKAESAEDKSENDESDDESAKSMMSIPEFLAKLSSQSRITGKSELTMPPDFASHLAKGGVNVDEVLASEIERTPLNDAILAKSLRLRMRMGASNPDLWRQFTVGLASAPEGVVSAFANAGIVASRDTTTNIRFV